MTLFRLFLHSSERPIGNAGRRKRVIRGLGGSRRKRRRKFYKISHNVKQDKNAESQVYSLGGNRHAARLPVIMSHKRSCASSLQNRGTTDGSRGRKSETESKERTRGTITRHSISKSSLTVLPALRRYSLLTSRGSRIVVYEQSRGLRRAT